MTETQLKLCFLQNRKLISCLVRNVFPNNKKYATNTSSILGISFGRKSVHGWEMHLQKLFCIFPHPAPPFLTRGFHPQSQNCRINREGRVQGFFFSKSQPFYPKGNRPQDITLTGHVAEEVGKWRLHQPSTVTFKLLYWENPRSWFAFFFFWLDPEDQVLPVKWCPNGPLRWNPTFLMKHRPLGERYSKHLSQILYLSLGSRHTFVCFIQEL